MQIAELFVKMGVKGADTTARTMDGLKKGMQGLKDSSLATKAAVAAAVYGLQRLMSGAMEQGMTLQQVSQYTGMSAEMLQRWSKAASDAAGVGQDELLGVFRQLFDNFAAMDVLSEDAVKGINNVALKLGEAGVAFDRTKIKGKDGMNYLLESLRKYSQLENNDQVRSLVLGQKGFGLTYQMQNFLRGYKGNIMDIKPDISEAGVNALANMDRRMNAIGRRMQKVRNDMTLALGPEFLSGLEAATTGIEKLTLSLIRLNKHVPVLSALSEGVKALAEIPKAMGAAIELINGEFDKRDQGKKNIFGTKGNSLKDNAISRGFQAWFEGTSKLFTEGFNPGGKGLIPWEPKKEFQGSDFGITPSRRNDPVLMGPQSNAAPVQNINQSFNIRSEDLTNPQKAASVQKNAASEAFASAMRLKGYSV